MDKIKGHSGGTTFAEISKKNFRPIPALIPPAEIRQVFVDKAEPLHKRIVANVRQASCLAHLRDTLLPKLLSGDVRIRLCATDRRVFGACS